MTALLAVAAGGVGAVARFVLDAMIIRRAPGAAIPPGIIVINVLGSFLVGIVVGAATGSQALLSPEVAHLLGAGFCGGFTTFSTASLEAVKLWSEGGPRRAAAYLLLMVVGSILAAATGLWLGDLG